MTPDQYSKTAAEFLNVLVDAGMDHQEIVAFCKFAAEACDRLQAAGIEPAEVLSTDLNKLADGGASLGGAAILAALAGAGGAAANKLIGAGSRLAEKGFDTAVKYAPVAAVGGLAIPAIAGYAAGRSAGTMTDHADETVKSIQQRELVAMLHENARLVRQQKQIEEAAVARNPRRRRRI